MKRILLGLLALLAVLVVGIGIYYVSDSSQRINALRSGGTVIETSAGTVEYKLEGSSDDFTLLFFHGTPGGYDQGMDAEAGLQVLTLSRPGYLGTPLSTGATPAEQANAAVALLDSLKIGRVGVMGASGGGPAAYTFAAAYPERTIGLVAVEAISHSVPFKDFDVPSSDLAYWLMIKSLVLSQDDKGVVAQIAQNESDRALLAEQPIVQAQVAEMIWSVWPPSMRNAGFDNDMRQFDSLILPLETIQVPTLIVHGTKDQSVPYEHGEYAAARVKGSTLHAIEGAGHMMPFAHEAEVNGVVTDFFANLDENLR